MKVLVTGGAGYIGSHTCVELLKAGHDVVVLDDLSSGSAEALRRVGVITGRSLKLYRGDVRERETLRRVFSSTHVDAVLHFAALKAVGESVVDPLHYYDVNAGGTIALAETMVEAGVRNLVFSSSATVYGVPDDVPVRESAPLAALNPYGRSKLMGEQILKDLQSAVPSVRLAVLRYFNPGGAHPSGLIGESPCGVPNNLMPFVTQVAAGQLERLRIFGGDYPTPDGTGVRDYIHVVDLARGHLSALGALAQEGGAFRDGGVLTLNLGAGKGYSVLEVIRAFEQVCRRPIPYEITARRAGDVASCCADARLAGRLLGWRTEYGLQRICEDAWRWQQAEVAGVA